MVLEMTTEEKFELLKKEGLEILKKYHIDGILDLKNYKIEMHRKKNSLGTCNPSKKVIWLSKLFLEVNSIETMRDVLLHEIAHALTPKDGHGKLFKEAAKMLGCNKNNLGYFNNTEHNAPKGKYVYECINCHKIAYFHRKLKNRHSCGWCSKSFDEKYLLKEVKGY